MSPRYPARDPASPPRSEPPTSAFHPVREVRAPIPRRRLRRITGAMALAACFSLGPQTLEAQMDARLEAEILDMNLDGAAGPGELIEYTLTVRHTQSAASFTDAFRVELPLPQETSWLGSVAVSGVGTECPEAPPDPDPMDDCFRVELGEMPSAPVTRVYINRLQGYGGPMEGNEAVIEVSARVEDPVTVGVTQTEGLARIYDDIDGTGFPEFFSNPTFMGGPSGMPTTTPLEASDGFWRRIGNLDLDRTFHTATLLLDGTVLVAGGFVGGTPAPVDASEIFDPFSGTSRTLTSPMPSGFGHHTATLLADGTVLVVGTGELLGRGTSVLAALFDPATETWQDVTGALTVDPGQEPTLTRLPDGRALAVGLFGAWTWETGVGWTDTSAPAGVTRRDHTATLLVDGKVFVAGGEDAAETRLATTFVFDPDDDSWTSGPALAAGPRQAHTSTLLPDDGRVLILGGDLDAAETAANRAETYDPGLGSTALLAGAGEQAAHSTALLPSGRLLVVGESMFHSQVFDPDTGLFRDLEDPETGRIDVTLTPLPSGEILALGSAVWADTFREWDDAPEANEVAAGAPDGPGTLLTLPSGLVLRLGPTTGGSTVQVYDPDTETWSSSPATPDTCPGMPGPTDPCAPVEMGESPGAILLTSGRVLAYGWSPSVEVPPQDPPGAGQLPSLLQLYDPETGEWDCFDEGEASCTLESQDPLALDAIGPVATLLPDGRVFFTGQGSGRREAWILDVETPNCPGANEPGCIDPSTESRWEQVRSSIVGRVRSATAPLPDGGVILIGGTSGDGTTVFPSVEIYDPSEDQWRLAPSLDGPRYGATALVLGDGRVMVLDGWGSAGGPMLGLPSIIDPAEGLWSVGPAPAAEDGVRGGDRPMVLPSGHVVVIDEENHAQLYDARAEEWSDPIALAPACGPCTPDQRWQTTLLHSGEVFAVDRTHGRSLVLRPFGAPAGLEPVLDAILPDDELGHDAASTLRGDRLGGVSEGASGHSQSSASHHPVVLLTAAEGARQTRLPVDALPDFCDGAGFCEPAPRALARGTVPDPEIVDLPADLAPGQYQLRVQTGGRTSNAIGVSHVCSPVLGDPADAVDVPIGTPATFSVSAAGIVAFQWQECEGDDTTCGPEGPGWTDVAGATSSSYTTAPISGPESGTRFRVVGDALCLAEALVSDAATLTVFDDTPPTVTVESPRGGEYWILSEGADGDPANWNQQTVSWSMSDDVRVCSVEVELLASNDGGTVYAPVPDDGSVPDNLLSGLPADFGPGGVCIAADAPTATATSYAIPRSPPSGSAGSLYKIRVTVTDHAGNPTEATSENPFFIVSPNPDSVTTLILHHVDRMETVQGISAGEATSLRSKLEELADHPRVQGVVVDLGLVTDVTDLFGLWDGDPTNVDLPNHVLFGCHDSGGGLPGECSLGEKDGVHDTLRALLEVYTAVENVVIVGDDRIVPLARIPDRGVLLQESAYANAGDLSDANGTSSVEIALAANKFLSDDPMATVDPIVVDDLSTDLFVPDLAIGRLVETVGEITTTIATFISTDGVVDLTEVAAGSNHRVFVAGYDFLQDTATVIRSRWKGALGDASGDGSLLPVNGFLISDDWDEANVTDRKQALFDHLDGFAASGSSGLPYAVHSLNGHANHYGEGLPGTDAFDIQGLDALDFVGAGSCATSSIGGAAGLDLAGTLLYSIGCHGGLPVPGECSTDDDHSLDLTQAVLRQGALAYVANTGYGWGLLSGIGYAERLVQILTEELTAGGSHQIGEAIVATKQRYVLENVSFDSYDEKSLQQWTLFGLPMTKLVTGISASAREQARDARGDVVRERPFRGEAPDARELPRMERHGPVVVERRTVEGATADGPVARGATAGARALPAYLTRLELFFDFSAPGVYTKRDANGVEITDDPGCPDEDGCYYTLNGLVERSTGATDLPIQPYFTFDSRLSGTSQHGVLWMGGTYEEESGWVPVTATLVSNDAGSVGSDHGSLPRTRMTSGLSTRLVSGENATCTGADSELNGLVVGAGQTTSVDGSDDRQRRFLDVDLQTFYFNNTADGTGNCDRTGPIFGTGPFGGEYHSVDGANLEWAVPVSDGETDVWRVVAVYTDNTIDDPDEDGRGTGIWLPVELVDDGGGTWRGSVSIPASTLATYVLQAVDARGNVTTLEFSSAETRAVAASGVDPAIPLPTDVVLTSPTVDLSVEVSDTPDPVSGGDALTYRMDVENQGGTTVYDVTATLVLPESVLYSGTAAGSGWSCDEDSGLVTCTRASLPPGTAPIVQVLAEAPLEDGAVVASAAVSAIGNIDPDASDDTDDETTTVVFSAVADLDVALSADRNWAPAGGLVVFSLDVTNLGPGNVAGAVLVDVFPPEIVAVDWACTPEPGASCPSSGSGNVIASLGLEAGASLRFTATASVAPDALGPLSHTASVGPPFGVHDPESENDAATTILPVALFRDGFESGDTSGWAGPARDLP